MEKTLTRETYRNIKAPWLVFGLLVVVGLSLLILYAVPGLPGRLGLPVLIIPTSYKNPVFEFDFPDPTILQATDGWYYVYATQGITPEFEYQNIQLARSQDLVHWQRLPDALPEKPVWAQNDVVPNNDYYPRVLLMDPIIHVDGWPQVPSNSPSYDKQSGPGVAVDLFIWVRQRTFKP